MTVEAPLFAEVADAPPGGRVLWLHSRDDMRLRTGIWAGGGRGTAFIFSGRSEYIEKYGRMIGRLVERDLTVVAFDWRGQGLSQRTHPSQGHVEDFRDYQRDWSAVAAHADSEDLPRPWYMFGHSMGACIGLRTLLEGTDFVGALFSAPMWHLQMRGATRQLTTSILAFEGNMLTSDEEHFRWFGRQLTAHPELGLAGPSVQWTYAALEEMARLYVAPLPVVPVLTFMGSDEIVVSTSVIRSQMDKMQNGRLVVLDRAKHEIWMERAEVQTQVWSEVDDFLDRVPSRRHRLSASA